MKTRPRLIPTRKIGLPNSQRHCQIFCKVFRFQRVMVSIKRIAQDRLRRRTLLLLPRTDHVIYEKIEPNEIVPDPLTVAVY